MSYSFSVKNVHLEKNQTSYSAMPATTIQQEIKTGTIVLQGCDACKSYGAIVEIGWRIINEVSSILWTMQPLPKLPPSPSDYVGMYIGRMTQTSMVSHL